MRRVTLDRWISGNSSIRSLLLLSIPLLTAGCLHRRQSVAETYHLQDAATYPLLVPSRFSSPSGRDVADTPVDLGRLDPAIAARSRCSIEGPVFSMRPPEPATSKLWLVRSPSVRQWETRGDQIDTVAEWSQFTQKLLSLEKNGCFASGSTRTNLRTIAESIPIPASELLLFYYSYNGTGAVDLVPGMQIRVERGVLDGPQGDQTMKSIEAQYEVIPTSASGVALRLSHTSNRNLSRETGQEDKNIFDLAHLTQTATMLRLFLQARTDKGVESKPMLLLASSREALDTATRRLDSSASNGCATVNVDGASCVAFTKSSVSLMISCTINGKHSYKPLGTTVTQVTNDNQPTLNSLVLSRRMTNGAYASLNFPKTLEAAGQVMLVNGDRLSW